MLITKKMNRDAAGFSFLHAHHTDMDRDGFIGVNELYQTLSTLVGRSIPDAHLEQVGRERE